MEIIVPWLLAGFTGAMLTWWAEREFFGWRVCCPSPRAIVLCILASPLGVFPLLLALISWCENWSRARKLGDAGSSWWSRPICGPEN